MANLNSPLKNAKGLGSAHEGVKHFWTQRISAVALIPLSLWFVFSVLSVIKGGGGVIDATNWLSHPVNAFLMMLFIGTGYFHAYLGFRVVVEDYISSNFAKFAIIIIAQLGAFFMTALTIFSILRIYFEG